MQTSDDGRTGDRAPGPRRPARERGEYSTRGSRGQTTIDFAIGVSLFLSVMLFVFAFVPGILQPFSLSGEQDAVLSERIAAKLSQGLLGDPSTPYVLESHCTVQFFEEGTSSPDHCLYEGETINERLALEDYRNVNVTFEGTLEGTDSDLVCWDETSQDLLERGHADCDPTSGDDDVILTGGDTIPTANDATVTSRRVVSLHQQNVTMKVVVW